MVTRRVSEETRRVSEETRRVSEETRRVSEETRRVSEEKCYPRHISFGIAPIWFRVRRIGAVHAERPANTLVLVH
jgi:hypothetical protein